MTPRLTSQPSLGKDPRYNAPERVSDLSGEALRQALLNRDRSARQRYMETYRGEVAYEVATPRQPSELTRRVEYAVAGLVVLGVTILAVSL